MSMPIIVSRADFVSYVSVESRESEKSQPLGGWDAPVIYSEAANCSIFAITESDVTARFCSHVYRLSSCHTCEGEKSFRLSSPFRRMNERKGERLIQKSSSFIFSFQYTRSQPQQWGELFGDDLRWVVSNMVLFYLSVIIRFHEISWANFWGSLRRDLVEVKRLSNAKIFTLLLSTFATRRETKESGNEANSGISNID